MLLSSQTLLRKSATMATAKVSDDRKLFEIVCYVFIRSLKVSASHILPGTVSELYKKTTWVPGEGGQIPPFKIGLMKM